jgi:thiamine biosynthesis lipoprotein
MRRNQIIMGTGVSLDIPAAKDDKIFEEVFELLKKIDARFSPYKVDSELSEFQRGKILQKNLSPQMKEVKAACKKFEKLTDGYFTANFAGHFDPTGYVKGWAIAEAGKLIENLGYKTFCLGIGGDILAASNSDKIWQIGIQDPQDSKEILNKLSISNGAVATSGNYERGGHILNPKAGQPADELLSITVVGPDIIIADVLATAGFAMGRKGPDFVNSQKGYQALAVARKIVAPYAGRANTEI